MHIDTKKYRANAIMVKMCDLVLSYKNIKKRFMQNNKKTVGTEAKKRFTASKEGARLNRESCQFK